MRIDLHTHSHASDGTDSPAQVMAAAAAAGLDVVALTDHDTTAGWDDAMAARPDGLTVVPGVEFSCVHTEPDGRRISLHLLAYLIDPDHEQLRAEWRRLRASRRARAQAMVENLVADGYPISWNRIDELAAGASIGRPHLARALVDAGVVPDVDSAFRDLLSSRRVGADPCGGRVVGVRPPDRAPPWPRRVRRDDRRHGRSRARRPRGRSPGSRAGGPRARCTSRP
jgi:predicted metal-dependent phosphoesterase TrpH